MKYIKVSAKNAEKTKRKLMRQNLLDAGRRVKHSKSYVYFPIGISKPKNKKVSVRRRSSDMLGNMAIIDTGNDKKAELAFAREILKKHKNVKTILAKASAIAGRYRTRKFRHVLGERGFAADYNENGCRFRFDVRKTYFSNRLSFERARIVRLVKRKENVMVFFSGVGPFAIEIAKAHRDANVVGIELNKYASEAAEDNIILNKLSNVASETGDVKKIYKKYRNFANRILMPLPMSSLDYLDEAFAVAKNNAIVHLYAFGATESAFRDITKRITDHAKKKGYKIRPMFKRVVRPYSAKDVEVVLDYKISK